MNAAGGFADLVITGGSVRTMDDRGTVAEALAIAGGRLAAVGSAAEVRPLVGPRTRVIGLRGETVLPGFQDAHVHPLIGGRSMLLCDLHDQPDDRDAYLAAIGRYAAANPGREWIVGAGWSMPAFPSGTPSRHDLDAVVPDRPAIFDNRDGHGAWANTRALALAGVTAATPDPADGRIEREADGGPQGTLHEGAARLVNRLVPPFTQGDWEDAILAAQAHLHACGITAITDAWVERQHVPPYRSLAERGELTLRTRLALWWERGGGLEQLEWFEDARRAANVGRLRADAVKLMLDGVLETFTGAMLEPYLGAGGRPTANCGMTFIDPDRLARELAPALDRAGFQLHFHAIGDRAVRLGLDAVAAVRAARAATPGSAGGAMRRRAHIAHLQVVDPADIPRFAELDVAATMQPYWACNSAQMTELTIPYLGPVRTARQYPFASLERAGARIAAGSDWSVSTSNVLAEVEVAVTRVAPADRGIAPSFLPGEALTLEAALHAFTRGSAWVHDLDTTTGTLEAGRLADVCVLDRDVFDRGAGPIGDARVDLTLVEGVPVFERAGFA